MFNHAWKKELFTIPNLLSGFRLLLIPIYIHLYLHASRPLDYYLSGTVLGISCLTDLADGKIARAYHMTSNVGKLLDPLADKLTQFSLILTLSGKYTVLYPVVLIFLLKESFQCVSFLIFAQKGKFLPGALLAGKVCTTILFASLTLLVLFPELNKDTVRLLVTADSASLLYTFYAYILAYFGQNSRLTDLKEN